VVLLNAVVGYLQEARAEQAVAALRRMSAAHANVMRDDTQQSIAAADVVPGDTILVEEGDTIPAGARLIQSTALETAEAALTGESQPVSKIPKGFFDPKPENNRLDALRCGGKLRPMAA
jgi:Ca2+-transporting ATPase